MNEATLSVKNTKLVDISVAIREHLKENISDVRTDMNNRDLPFAEA
jgi:hypothetical protein